MASSHLPHGGGVFQGQQRRKGETFQPLKNWKEKRGGATQGWGFPKTRTNNGGGAYKRRLRTRKECELGRAAATFDILKNRDSRKEGRLGQVTLLSGARTTRLLHLRWSVNNDFLLDIGQIYITFARPRGSSPVSLPKHAVRRSSGFLPSGFLI